MARCHGVCLWMEPFNSFDSQLKVTEPHLRTVTSLRTELNPSGFVKTAKPWSLFLNLSLMRGEEVCVCDKRCMARPILDIGCFEMQAIPFGPWLKVVPYLGNRVPFGTQTQTY